MRLTDADAYKDFHRRECPGCCCTCTACAEDMTCKLIDEAPTVEDAVIVTRCKDCKYGSYDSKSDGASACGGDRGDYGDAGIWLGEVRRSRELAKH